MFKNLNHLCFDKDGVLIDVHAYWSHTTNIRADLIRNKLHLNSDQQITLIESMGINTLNGKIKNMGPVGYKPRQTIIQSVKDSLINFGIKINLTDIEKYFIEVDEYQQKHSDYKIVLLDGVSDFLEEKINTYKMSIFTSDRKENAILTLAKLGIDKYFSVILGGDSVNKSKPDPEGILKACLKVNIKPKNTVYITDTSSDLLMARNANCFTIGILTGLGSRKGLNVEGDLVCNNFFELAKFL